MKTKINYLISLILITLLSSCLNTNAQAPAMEWQKKNNQLPDRSREHITNPMQLSHSAQDNPPVHNKKTNLLNKKSLTWQWDTIITYDTLGLLQRLTQTFDNNGNILIKLTEQWQSNAWVDYYKDAYTYDANRNMLTYLVEKWQNNKWVNSYRGIYTYDANENMLTFLTESWQSNVWVSNLRQTYTYDINGNMLTKLEEFWQSNAWVNHLRQTYTYDANGNILTDLIEVWQSNAWMNYYREAYTCDANGNMLTFLQEKWQNNAWVNDYRQTCTYDANGNELTYLREDWQSNAWVNDEIWTYTYDANGNMLTYLGETWQVNAWINSNKETYTYDANGNSLTGKYETWETGNWQPSKGYLTLYYKNDYISWLINMVYRYEASYKSFNTGIANQVNNSCITVYPNPSNGVFTINITGLVDAVELSITNLQGQEVYKETLNVTADYTKQLALTSYPKGIYFVKLQSNDIMKVEKLILQ